MDGVLVIGIGNPLRTDDGVGWRAVERVAADPRLAGVRTLTTHQLLPELAWDVSAATLVVLVDARVGVPAGELVSEPVVPVLGAATAWSHHLDPPTLAGMALELYGAVPPVVAVGVGVGSMDVGEGLTPQVAAAVPAIVALVGRLIEAHRPTPTEVPVHA